MKNCLLRRLLDPLTSLLALGLWSRERSRRPHERAWRRARVMRYPNGPLYPRGFAVDAPAPGHRRTTVRRGGFTSHDSAEEACGGSSSVRPAGPTRTEPDRRRLSGVWLAAKALVPKPTKTARYRDFVRNEPTTTARYARKAALSSMRERPPTC